MASVASLPTSGASSKSLGGSVSFTEVVALGVIKTGQPGSVIPRCSLAVQNGLADLYVLKNSVSTMVCCSTRVRGRTKNSTMPLFKQNHSYLKS